MEFLVKRTSLYGDKKPINDERLYFKKYTYIDVRKVNNPNKLTILVEAPNKESAMRKAEKQFKDERENFRTKVGSVSFALIREV